MATRTSRTFKNLNRTLGRAVHLYGMISDGDRIMVGLSGGKDSLTLLWMLNERKTRIPIGYELRAVYVDPGFDPGFGDPLMAFCQDLGVPLQVETTDFGVVAHGPTNRENPCFLCARRRRQRIFEVAERYGCNKIALGHNKDDIIETVFMNMAFAGEISTMAPSQSFFDGRFTIIRPLAYTDEQTIYRFSEESGFPKLMNPCPSAGTSRRRVMKEFLSTLYATNRKIKGNIFRSLSRVRPGYLLK